MEDVFFKVGNDEDGRWKADVECLNCCELMTFHQAKGFEYLSPKPKSRSDVSRYCRRCYAPERGINNLK